MRLSVLALSAAALFASTPAQAEEGFKTTETCTAIFERATDIERVILGAWMTGYLDAVNQSESTLLRLDNAVQVMRNVHKVCERNPDMTILQMAMANQKNTADTPGTKAHAHAFLSQFQAPGADLRALTAALKPTEADIRAVYAPELAEKLIPRYEAMFTPDAQIGPKPGQTDLLIVRARTSSLAEGAPVLKEFPGGYEDVRPYLQGNFPIVRFKFVEPGATTGMAFDGLIYVNDRWVLMPKPWGAL